jgi:hypothetical protein
MRSFQRRRAADSYHPETPHPFMPIRDAGLGAFAISGSGVSPRGTTPLSAIVTTDNFLRKSGCAVPGCGKSPDDAIHAPRD